MRAQRLTAEQEAAIPRSPQERAEAIANLESIVAHADGATRGYYASILACLRRQSFSVVPGDSP